MDEEISPDLAEIKAVCIHLLAKREHSQLELLNKLQIKGYSREASWSVVESLIGQDWQSDSRFADNYVRSCIKRGYGPIYIKHHLQQQGIAGVDLDGIVEGTVGSWAWQIAQVYAKKYGQKPVTDNNDKAKRMRFLLQRGFSQAMINNLMNVLK